MKVTLTDSFGNGGSPVTSSGVTKDVTAPIGYTVAFGSSDWYNSTTSPTATFTITNGEAGARYYYTITTSGTGGSVGTTTSISGNELISGSDVHPGSTVGTTTVSVNLSSLYDGTLSLTVYLKDSYTNQGSDASAAVKPLKDATVPSAPTTVTIDQTQYASGSTAMSFKILGAELGTTYHYTVSTTGSSGSTGSVTSLTSSGSITDATETDVSSFSIGTLYDGTVSLSVYLTDSAGNTGSSKAASASATKDTAAPTDPSVTIVETKYYTGSTTLSFKIGNAEAGASYTYTVASNGSSGGTAASLAAGSGTIAGTDDHPGTAVATTTIPGIDISTLYDGSITVKVTLTDSFGNGGSPVTSSGVTKDVTAPTSYTVAFGASSYTNATASSGSFTITDGEKGTTYSYTITTTGSSGTSPLKGSTASISSSGTVGLVSDAGHPGSTAASTTVNVDLSSLYDGTLSLTVYLTDTYSNQGGDQTASATEHASGPAVTAISSYSDTSITIALSEGAYKNSGATQDIDKNSFTVTDTTRSYTATLSNITYTSGGTTATLPISWSTTPQTGDTIQVAFASTVYDSAGNSTAAGSGSATKTKAISLLSLVGIKAPVNAVDRIVARAIGAVQSVTGYRAPETSSATPVTVAARQQEAASTTRSQFLTPLTAPVTAGSAVEAGDIHADCRCGPDHPHAGSRLDDGDEGRDGPR